MVPDALEHENRFLAETICQRSSNSLPKIVGVKVLWVAASAATLDRLNIRGL
jgi:hypothetical protein